MGSDKKHKAAWHFAHRISYLCDTLRRDTLRRPAGGPGERRHRGKTGGTGQAETVATAGRIRTTTGRTETAAAAGRIRATTGRTETAATADGSETQPGERRRLPRRTDPKRNRASGDGCHGGQIRNATGNRTELNAKETTETPNSPNDDSSGRQRLDQMHVDFG